MRWRQWSVCVYKELLLLSRDWHALALLFVMPLAFLLVMSLAMQEQFAAHAGSKISVVFSDRDNSKASQALLAALQAGGAASVVIGNAAGIEALKSRLRDERHAFAIDVASGYQSVLGDAKQSLDAKITLLVAADTSKQTELIFQGTLREIL